MNVTEEQVKFNYGQALAKEAIAKNEDDKAYWNKQASSWSELYTKLTKKVLS